MDHKDPLRGSDLPPTAPPPVPVGEGKHAVPTGPLVTPNNTPTAPVQAPDDPLTAAEFAHPPTPLALQARTLANDVVGLRKAADRLRRIVGWLIAATTTAIILAVVAVIILYFQSVTTKQLADQQTQINAQQRNADVIRRQALCPVFDLVLAAGPGAYDTFFTAIANGATALRCDTP